MDSYDYNDLMNRAKKAAEKLGMAFEHIWNAVLPGILGEFTKSFIELIEQLKEVQGPSKRIHKPVKEIRPNKLILLDKRLNRHYCRSNC